MRVFVIVSILVLLGTSLRFGFKNLALQHDLQTVCDTLYSQRMQQQFLEKRSHELLIRYGELDIQKNDSTEEMHRIIANYDDGFFLLRIERKIDNFRKVKIKNPILKDLKNAEFIVESVKQDLKLTDLQNFKSKLAQTKLLDATLENNLLCCFGGGTLSWEAYLEDGNRHYFRTFCRQSAEFTEACEFMFRKIDDKDLKKILK